MVELTSKHPLRLGWIPYWNLRPFRCELNRSDSRAVEILQGVPSHVNKLLDLGEVQLAPASSICLISKANLEMALPLGVAADGPVMSVYLGFYSEHCDLLERLKERRKALKKLFSQCRLRHSTNVRSLAKAIVQESQNLAPLPLAKVPGMRVTVNSASSAVLARIFFNLWFGCEAYKLMVDRDVSMIVYTRRPIELLIGDEALQKKHQFHTVLDLGQLWKEMTGLPFVYAVWQSKGACLNGWRRKILDVGMIAETRMRVDPFAYLPEGLPADEAGKTIPLAEYWKCIYYRLGQRELRGLLLFLCLARTLHLTPMLDEALGKILRWEDMSLRDVPPII